jgi:hypothetical protein
VGWKLEKTASKFARSTTETTRLEKEEAGKPLPHFNTRTFFCPVAKKEFTVESPLGRAS